MEKGGSIMELDKAFHLAVVQGWDDLTKKKGILSARVEYISKPGTPLEHLGVWTTKAWGDCDLVCDYWMQKSSAHPVGVSFWNGFYSSELASSLDFIMKNQDQFTRSASGCSAGLVLIKPPTEDEKAEGGVWMKELHVTLPLAFGAVA
jgi:hypothetical protein